MFTFINPVGVSVSNGEIHIIKSWIKPPAYEGTMKDHHLHYFTDIEGKVQKSYIKNIKDGKIFNLKIAKNGEPNYIKNITSNSPKKSVITSLGTFDIKKVIAHSNIVINSSGVVKNSYVFYINKNVNFRIVRMEFVSDVRFTEDSSEKAKLAKQMDSGMKGMDSVAIGIANWIGGGKHFYNLNLIESN